MILHRMAIGSLVLSMLALLGCENGAIGDGGKEDPIAGKWTSDACHGGGATLANIESCSVELDLQSDLDLELKADWVSLPATEERPGCTTTRRVTGLKWHTDHKAGTLTVTGMGNATIERTGCVKAEDNLKAEPTQDIEVRPGDMAYELKGDTLTILSGSLQGTYAR